MPLEFILWAAAEGKAFDSALKLNLDRPSHLPQAICSDESEQRSCRRTLKKVSGWCAAVRFKVWQAFFCRGDVEGWPYRGVSVCVSSPQNVFLETPFVVWTTTERSEHFAKGLLCQQDNKTGVFTGV